MRVGLVGLGYWGPNLARVFQQSTRCEFSACCDLDKRKVERALAQYPSVKGFDSAQELFRSDVDAVAIATSISTHYDLAKEALLHGKHVFVEKPLCDSAEKAQRLV